MTIKISLQTFFLLLSSILITLFTLFSLFNFKHTEYFLYFLFILVGVPLIVETIIKIFNGNFGADILAAASIITGVILKENLAVAIIIFMVVTGKYLEQYAVKKASSVLQALEKRMPIKAHKYTDHNISEVLLDEIKINDKIMVYPHETCPVDGVVIEGRGFMDESYLTGEPYLIAKAPGVSVLSGSINQDTPLLINTTKLVANSRYASIIKVLSDSEKFKPKIRRLGDKIGMMLGPLVIIFALLVWYFYADPIRFLSVIVIATPCPLIIAIPIAIISSISIAAKNSIIIKDPAVLELLPICKIAIFDKTGTLTYGRPELTEISTISPYQAEEILQYAASLEKYSKHPLANAILNKAKADNINLLDVEHMSEKPGLGLSGRINNHLIHITGRKKLSNVSDEAKVLFDKKITGLECVMLIDNKVAAIMHFHDQVRPESRTFISHLKPSHKFEKVMIVSGDRHSEVEYLGKLVGLNDIYASQSPEQKLAIVKKEAALAPTVFMGDGINDAPALTHATVGIAFGEFSDISAAASGAVIMENSFDKVDQLVHISLETRKIILQSSIGGIVLSLVGMIFAALGYIKPVYGALLQEIIDVLAILNALQLVWKDKIFIDLPKM